jgi:hypothetical protein
MAVFRTVDHGALQGAFRRDCRDLGVFLLSLQRIGIQNQEIGALARFQDSWRPGATEILRFS